MPAPSQANSRIGPDRARPETAAAAPACIPVKGPPGSSPVVALEQAVSSSTGTPSPAGTRIVDSHPEWSHNHRFTLPGRWPRLVASPPGSYCCEGPPGRPGPAAPRWRKGEREPMRSTMQEAPLLVREILRHGAQVYGPSEVVTFEGDSFRRATFAEVAARAAQLAHGLAGLGVGEGDRVGTFCFNHQEHVEAYLAIRSMGAVLHTLNIRLFPEQLRYVIDHAGDKVVICDAAVAGLLARVVGECPTVERVVVVGSGDVSALERIEGLGERLVSYEELLAGQPDSYEWPDLDEREAAAMCYTSGTTGNPKGVAYSHRSTYLHSLASTSSATLGISSRDRILVVVPQFHANAWGIP